MQRLVRSWHFADIQRDPSPLKLRDLHHSGAGERASQFASTMPLSEGSTDERRIL
jgi:hypothetical protein